MSERRQRGRAEQFKHQQDRAFQEDLKRKHLFSNKPEIFTQTFRCSPIPSPNHPPLNVQDGVLLVLRNGSVDVTFDSMIVGHIECGLDMIYEALASDPRAGAMIKATVCLPPGLSGSFEVRVCE